MSTEREVFKKIDDLVKNHQFEKDKYAIAAFSLAKAALKEVMLEHPEIEVLKSTENGFYLRVYVDGEFNGPAGLHMTGKHEKLAKCLEVLEEKLRILDYLPRKIFITQADARRETA